MMTMLPVPSSGHIDTVIHISDTHIERETESIPDMMNI